MIKTFLKVNPKHFAEMAEQDGGMVGEIDAGLTLSRDIRFEDPLCQKPICAKSGRPFV